MATWQNNIQKNIIQEYELVYCVFRLVRILSIIDKENKFGFSIGNPKVYEQRWTQ